MLLLNTFVDGLEANMYIRSCPMPYLGITVTNFIMHVESYYGTMAC